MITGMPNRVKPQTCCRDEAGKAEPGKSEFDCHVFLLPLSSLRLHPSAFILSAPSLPFILSIACLALLASLAVQ
jgi:hypothetical protein